VLSPVAMQFHEVQQQPYMQQLPQKNTAQQAQYQHSAQPDVLALPKVAKQEMVCAQAPEEVAELLVQVGGRLLPFPRELAASHMHLTRELAAKLQISGSAALQLADSAGRKLNNNEDLRAALRDGRVPLQASLTAVALRDVEQRKSEVESKKAEFAQLQWQIVVDKIGTFSSEVAGMATLVQEVKAECHRSINQCQAEEAMQRDHIAALLDKECTQREVALKDIDYRLHAVVQSIASERSAREVAFHQLQKQMESVVQALEAERSFQAENRAEAGRALQTMKHDIELEQHRNADNWAQHLGMAKRFEVRLDEKATVDSSAQYSYSQLAADFQKLHSSVAQVESTLALQKRSFDETLQRRAEELSKAVRDEVLGRENHFARFARDLETSFQSMEAKMGRSKEDATSNFAALVERTRLLELRCDSVEAEMTNHRDLTSERDLSTMEKLEQAWTTLDGLDAGIKASDVVLKATVTKVESLLERLSAAESDLQLRPRHDFFKPQMEALHRACQKQESRLGQLEKDVNARFAVEAVQRDNVKAQLRTSVRTCLDKIGGMQSSPNRAKEAVRIDMSASQAGSRAAEIVDEPLSGDPRMAPSRVCLTTSCLLANGSQGPLIRPPGGIHHGQVLSCSPSGVSTPVMPSVPHAMVQLVPVSANPASSRPASPLMGSSAVAPSRQGSPLVTTGRQVPTSASAAGYLSPRPPMMLHTTVPLHTAHSFSAGHLVTSPRRIEPSTR